MNKNADLLEGRVVVSFQKIHEIIERSSPYNNYLLEGKLGLVLYYFSLYEAFGGIEYANKCIELLEEVMNQEGDEPSPLAGTGFANGTAGLGYILSVLQKAELIDIDLQEELNELDESMAVVALRQIEQEDRIDYLHGAMGVIHYFTARSDEPGIRRRLELLVTALCNKAVIHKDGVWFRNFIVDEKEKERIDLGLSHGNPGFLLLLLNVLEAGFLETKLKETISKGIQFIISQQVETNPEKGWYAAFPFSVHSKNDDDKYFSQRLAWCYGDLNIILLLYRAAAQLNEPAWREMAGKLAEQTRQRTDRDSTLAGDSHFCHGTAGLAQVYKKLFAITADERFRKCAEYWIDLTLKYLDKELEENMYENKECDLLNGLPGINLVLLSCICKKELTWSKLLLL